MIDEYVSREELLRLLSGLVAVCAAIALFALFAFIVVPGLRNANKPAAAVPVARPQGETGWLDPTDYPPVRGYTLPAVDPKPLLTASPELLKKGAALYAGACAACHGANGRGDGPAATGMKPAPRDFSRTTGWKNGRALPGIFKALSEGIPGGSMAAYDFMPAADRMALAHHVQSLGPPATEDRTALGKLSASLAAKGRVVASRIPVRMATQRLIEEFRPPAPLPMPLRGVRDPQRAAQTLAGTPGWRRSAAALAQIAAAGAPANGFSVSVAAFSPAQWSALHRELSKRPPR